ncbi:MAG TPA: TolC family protein [Candidatus Omnitrophota bacterium]|nr:TolC family protein [Candidatus Omnitrophota bacterium]HPS20497.1 TolC family protein [Candidatus Omnitrophota bacterium]
MLSFVRMRWAMCLKNIFSVLIVFSLSIVLTVPVYSEEITPAASLLTFSEFCQKVLAYYPKIKQSGVMIETAIARRFQAATGLMPKVVGLSSMTTSDDQVYVFGTLLRQRSFTQDDFALSHLNDPSSRTNYNIGLHAEMPLFDALKTIYKVKAAESLVASAKHDEMFTKMEAILIAFDVYSHAVMLEKMIEITDDACARSESDIKQAEELKQKGLVLGADFYAAKVILGRLKSIRNELVQKRSGLNAVMNILMGEAPNKQIQTVDVLKNAFAEQREMGLWLDEAYKLRPDLCSLDEVIHAQGFELEREKMSMLPNISAFGDLNENTQDFNKGGGSFAVGIKGSMDLFDPEYFARVKISKNELRKLELDRTIARDAVARDISEELAKYHAFAANMSIMNEMSEDSKQAVALMAPLYQEGRKSILDLLETRSAYVNAYGGYFETMLGMNNSSARLFFLSGQLDESKAVIAFGSEGK